MGDIADIVTTVNDRITAHTDQGRLLEGYTFESLPVAAVDGDTALPSIRAHLPDYSETHKPSNMVMGTLILRYAVSTKKDDGVSVLMEAVAKFLDALDREDNDSKADESMDDLTAWTWEAKTAGCTVTDVSLTARMEITFTNLCMERGNRNG